MDSGWRLVRGAGGYSYWHEKNRWITSVYLTDMEARIAAEKLEAGAMDVLRRERAKREERTQ